MAEQTDRFRLFKPMQLPRDPGDFSWVGFPENDARTGVMKDKNLVREIESLSETVSTIILRGNNLGRSAPDLIPAILKAVKPPVKALDFSHNEFFRMEPHRFIDALKKIPSSINRLILNNNRLGTLPFPTFESILGAIPETVETIHVFHNLIDQYLPSHLEQLMESLGDRVRGIICEQLAPESLSIC